MNTFHSPPQMPSGSYQGLPPRNPRSGRSRNAKPSNTKGQQKPADRKANPYAARPANKPDAIGLFGITLKQWIVLGILFACFMLPLFLHLVAEGKLKQLHSQREAAEKKYQQEVASHKVRYEDWIRYYAAVNNIDPAFVAAIIKRESDYDPYAVSRVGARGLMQIMPENLEWLAGKVDLYDYSLDTLFDAESNIKMGCWYLGYLSRLFGGDPITVACAYHAGQGNVRDHWLPKYSANGSSLTLDEIPMDDTKYYAGKVLEAYAIYQQHHYR